MSAPLPTSATGFTTVALEGVAFTVPAGTIVFYGAGATWTSKVVNGAGTCDNAFFGGDPAYMTVKTCVVANPPPPPPPPSPVVPITPAPPPLSAVALTYARTILPAGTTTVTQAMLDGKTIISNSSETADTILKVPSFAEMGWVRDPARPLELILMFQRIANGKFTITGSAGVRFTWNSRDPATLPVDHALVGLITVDTDSWAAF